MKSPLPSLAILAICCCQSFAAPPPDAAPADRVFRAGAATVDITPPKLPVIIAGGFLEGKGTKIMDPLHARCLVLDDGKTKIAFAIVDTCMMPQALLDDAKKQASTQCGIPVDHLMVSATHTHSAPAAMGCLGTRQDKDYAAWLPGKIAEGIVAAAKQLQPARIGWASLDDWEHTHNRRWIRQPDKMIVDPFGNATGRANMHPGYLSADVIGPSGPVDPGLSVLSVQTRDGKPLAVLANYSQHYFGFAAVSADYYGLFCKHVARLLGQPGEGNGPFVCAMSQGTSGDLMWMDYGSPKKTMSGDEYAESVARYAEQALRQVKHHDTAPLAMVEKKLTLNYRVPDEQRLAWARPIAARIVDDLPKDKQEVYAQEAMILHERQKTEIKLQAIRIGELTISTLPNEVYALTGLKLKAQSPFASHFNIELANGAEGYIPTPEQHVLGGYTTWPARTAGLEVQAEPKIVAALLDALEEATGAKRRAMQDEHGPYAKAVLDAKPSAYWRLNDADGKIARNAVSGGVPAQVSDGAAWYLPGAGSGTGCGLHEKLTPSAFSGPNQINRALHLAGGDVQADIAGLGDHYSIALWFWLGEASGAGERSGTLIAGPGGEVLGTRQSKDHSVQLVMNGAATKLKLRADDWHFAVLIRDGNALRVHVDGIENAAIVETSPVQSKGNHLRFGQNMEGKLDEVSVFNRALTPAEIAGFWKTSGIGEAAAVAMPKPKMESEPLSPEESLKKVHVRDGYKVELVAAEPLVLDPVAFDWDERGRLWVVEMADYPLGMDGKGKPGGRVRILEDTDGDGRYDKSTIFADGLNFPTGILCWRDGCIVTAAPDILFLKDSSGGGKADVRQKLFTGFQEGNQQLRVNGLRWGFDGWVYCANGGHHVNYGKDIAITSMLTGEKIALGSRDFRFKPDTGAFDPLSGPSQFGRNRDAWGHWFGVQNSFPLWHYVLEDRYLRRNPHVAPPSPKVVLTASNPAVFPASAQEKRFHSFDQAGHFTSACSAMIYLDTLLFGASSAQHSFTCEPFHNVVQHLVVEDDGVTFKAHRDDSEKADFFASEDRWCRPVMARTGPDGALWIADMYRYIIEHPQWLPQNGKDELSPFYRLGDDKGRIYRVLPNGARPEPMKNLGAMKSGELVTLLESTNGWLRDKAQMLLLWRADKSVVPALEKMAHDGNSAHARAYALSVLDGFTALKSDQLITALRDPAPGVREHALRIAETHGDDAVVAEAAKLTDDTNAKVRLQLALSLGEWKQPAAGSALAKLALKDADNAVMRGAIVSSMVPHLATLAAQTQGQRVFMDAALSTALGEQKHDAILAIADTICMGARAADDKSLRTFRALLHALRANNTTLEKLAAQHAAESRWHEVIGKKDRIIAALKNRPAGDDSAQAFAASVLLADPRETSAGVAMLGKLLGASFHAEPFAEHVTTLAQSGDARVPGFLMQDWEQRTPAQREPILDAMMTREEWAVDLLGRIGENKVAASSLDAQRQARLLKHPSAKVQKLAAQVFASTASASRAKVLEAFQPALALRGDAARGKAVFGVACIACHQLDGVGRVLGPDLRSVVQHPPEKLLNSILDPSAIIEPGFTAYFCELKNGEQLYGIIAGETGGSLTFKLADSTVRNILRPDVVKLQSSKASLMPDGLEAALTPQSLADLIAYLKAAK